MMVDELFPKARISQLRVTDWRRKSILGEYPEKEEVVCCLERLLRFAI